MPNATGLQKSLVAATRSATGAQSAILVQGTVSGLGQGEDPNSPTWPAAQTAKYQPHSVQNPFRVSERNSANFQ